MAYTLASDEQLELSFNRSRDELVCLADKHTFAVQAWLSSRAPQAVRFEGKGTIASSTGLGVSLLNLALGCHYEGNTDAAALADEIEAVKMFFAQRNVPWVWWVSPRSQPADIGQHLERHGLVRDWELPAMIAPLPGTGVWPSSDNRIWVSRVTTRADLQAASLIRRTAFEFPEGVAVDYFEAMETDWLDDASRARLYLAGCRDQPPAAMGALIIGAGLPGVYVMATLPEYRRQGLGKAVLRQLLTEATKQGYSLVVLTAGPLGYPLYTQFGFLHLFNYSFYFPKISA
jgi:GNAT superfamily N-acetyltransferase